MVINFEFIESNPVTDPKPGKSSQIRSRCMRGRNKREGSRRSQREEKRLAKEEQAARQHIQEAGTSSIPPLRNPLSALALIQTPGVDIDIEAKSLVVKAFAYDITNRALSPLEHCVDFDLIERTPFEWVFSDAAFVHSILCTSFAFNDFNDPSWDGQLGQNTLLHLRQTLNQLQLQMSHAQAYQDEALLNAVLNLVLLSAGWTDSVAACAHFAGLQQIVQLRGGLGYLSTRPKLHFKLDRLDLAWSLSSGKASFFQYPVMSWDSCFLRPEPAVFPGQYIPPLEWDHRLVNVFQDLQHLSIEINGHVQRYARYDSARFQSVLTSVQSRLLQLRDMLESPIEEMVRLSMLFYLTRMVKIPGRKIPYGWMGKQTRIAYDRLAEGPFEEDKRLCLWSLIVAAVSIANGETDWLSNAWRRVAVGVDWPTVRQHALSVMWIDVLFDHPAESAYQRLNNVAGA